MKRMKHAVWTMRVALPMAIASCLVAKSAAAASFTSLNVFGDSLVDSGNLFNLTSSFSPLGVPAIPPSPPYAQNNSNGPLWIDNVGQALGLAPALSTELSLNPTAPPPTQGINFAFSGALSSDVHNADDDFPALADSLPGFLDQIDAFTALSATIPADPDALHVIWVGANDYYEAFADPDSLGDTPSDQLPNAVTDNILNGLSQLSSLGAKEFLVVNLPPLGEVPFANTLDTLTGQDISTVLNQLSTAHNDLLAAKLSTISQSQPETNITALNANALFTDILTNPEAFELTNATDACLLNFQPGFQFDGICENPDEFLFWDDVHPTTAAYQLVSDLALAELEDDAPPTAVPEPATPLTTLLLGGMALGTFKTRRWWQRQDS
ncbi:MAG: SGNH/GDSL hydrolase family protein [Cyanobacteria bacterium J06636_16]